ncbi:MAG: hypothetical protein FJ088_00840 [Deltaproteobacteria bacterium]|nr:hypothetical protein [Deltaproteobacteria bacterium]
MSYIEEIEQFFIQLTCHGVSLSPGEIKLIVEWRDRGIPLNVVRKALMKGVYLSKEFSFERKLRLTRFRKSVENEFQSYKKRMDGITIGVETSAQHEPSGDQTPGIKERLEKLAAKIEGMAEKCAIEPSKSLAAASYKRAAAKIAKIPELIEDDGSMMEMAINVINSMPGEFLETLEENERDEILKERDAIIAAGSARIGRKALEEKRNSVLAELLEKRCSLVLPEFEV